MVAPRLADELGLHFVDRLISADDSQHPAAQDPTARCHSEEGLVEGEKETAPTGRFLSYFARAAAVGTIVPPDPVLDDDEEIRARVERALVGIRAGEGAVLLGRAGAVVLASRPNTFHVRLDGPADRRIVWAAGHERLDLPAARQRQVEADRARSGFVKRLYRRDPSDPALYHLVVDPTVIGIEATVAVVRLAAGAFFASR